MGRWVTRRGAGAGRVRCGSVVQRVCKRRVPVATAVQLREWLGRAGKELGREDSGGVAVGSSPVRAARPPASSARPSRHPDWHQSHHIRPARAKNSSASPVASPSNPGRVKRAPRRVAKIWGSTCLPASPTVVDQTLRGSRSRRCHLGSFAEVTANRFGYVVISIPGLIRLRLPLDSLHHEAPRSWYQQVEALRRLHLSEAD